jgi:hypothetical protein
MGKIGWRDQYAAVWTSDEVVVWGLPRLACARRHGRNLAWTLDERACLAEAPAPFAARHGRSAVWTGASERTAPPAARREVGRGRASAADRTDPVGLDDGPDGSGRPASGVCAQLDDVEDVVCGVGHLVNSASSVVSSAVMQVYAWPSLLAPLGRLVCSPAWTRPHG